MNIKCPVCQKQASFQFVGSHWRLICLVRYCEAYFYINGNSEEEILAKIKAIRRKSRKEPKQLKRRKEK